MVSWGRKISHTFQTVSDFADILGDRQKFVLVVCRPQVICDSGVLVK